MTDRRIAGERRYRNQGNPRYRDMTGTGSSDQIGAAGEVAFAEAFGFPVEEIERERPTGYNFRLKDGLRVDVRSSRAEYPRLLVPPQVANRSTIDVFVLASVKPEGTTLVGWAARAEVLAAPVVKVSEKKAVAPCHAIPPYELHDMEELKRHHFPHMKGLFDDPEG